MSQHEQSSEDSREQDHRRQFLAISSNLAMGGGLLAGYGTFAVMAGRFLYAEGGAVGWQFVATLDRIQPGEAFLYTAPSGHPVVIARQGEGETADDFIALSSVCPHLGCKVHWVAHNDRFFCPCHNGVFDPEGKAVSGPPAKGGQDLAKYPLKVEGGKLFIEVPLAHPQAGSQVARACPNENPSDDDPPMALEVSHG